MKLREHDITLRGETVVLRPMAEGDWDVLLKWNADLIFGCDIADCNPRSLRAFQKVGYDEIDARIGGPSGGKARYVYDVAMPREKWRSTE